MNTLDLISPTTPAEHFVKKDRFSPLQRKLFTFVCILLWSVISYLFISHFVMMAVQIKGISMSPTLLDGQRYILLRCPYLWRAPRHGEIVVIRDPEDHNLSIKRIIALPNELFEIRRDGVYVNDVKIPEPYLTPKALADSGNKLIKPTHLGPKDFIVLGDNRDFSADSRSYGVVPRDFILGRISR